MDHSLQAGGPNPSHFVPDPIQNHFAIDPDQVSDPVNQVIKRRPGRPKGSGKKSSLDPPALPKIKRPVGRPRKDGFPAGSVSNRRSVRPRRNTRSDPSLPQSVLGVANVASLPVSSFLFLFFYIIYN
jgi:hypothetical protein